VRAFCSPHASYVTADPGFEAGMFAASRAGARVVKVPLTRTLAHDVRAMLAAAPDGGVFYICQPNNPTGTLTSRADIEYLVENKPKKLRRAGGRGLHPLQRCAVGDRDGEGGKDVIVLRTFSKIYGMAGLRCGFAIARPDCWRSSAITAAKLHARDCVAAASASLKNPTLVAERKRTNEQVRTATFQCSTATDISYIPSVANFFPAGYQTSGQGGHRRHGAAEGVSSSGGCGRLCQPIRASPWAPAPRWSNSRRRAEVMKG